MTSFEQDNGEGKEDKYCFVLIGTDTSLGHIVTHDEGYSDEFYKRLLQSHNTPAKVKEILRGLNIDDTAKLIVCVERNVLPVSTITRQYLLQLLGEERKN